MRSQHPMGEPGCCRAKSATNSGLFRSTPCRGGNPRGCLGGKEGLDDSGGAAKTVVGADPPARACREQASSSCFAEEMHQIAGSLVRRQEGNDYLPRAAAFAAQSLSAYP